MKDSYKLAELKNILAGGCEAIDKTHGNLEREDFLLGLSAEIYPILENYFTGNGVDVDVLVKANEALSADVERLNKKYTSTVDSYDNLVSDKLNAGDQLEQALDANAKLYKDLVRKDSQVDRLISALTGLIKVNEL